MLSFSSSIGKPVFSEEENDIILEEMMRFLCSLKKRMSLFLQKC
jgi:hypothetical protein